MKKIILLVFVLALSFSSCEKDDICDANTPTTPRLVIGFYDFLNLSIPLKTVGTTTTYRFTLNSGNSNLALVDEDIIKFDYSTKELFVSRACGYKTNFTLDPTNPYTHTDPIAANQKWIKFISVEKNNIENENETHIKIFF